MPKSLKARKESSKKEREEGRVSEESLNPFRKSTRTERSPSRSEEENLTKKIEKEMKTMLREMREEKGQVEKADWMKRMKMIEEKMVQREKKERKNNVIITGIGGISGMVRKRDRDESEFLFVHRLYIHYNLRKEERETQKKLREFAREERDRGKKVKIGYRKINGEWFMWDEKEEKLKKNF
ncbi:hypothetical protein MTP99_004853 [Tenebrio molitor]|nr:hypothetical protein MTP99_004853 [Tenebrio molitor]